MVEDDRYPRVKAYRLDLDVAFDTASWEGTVELDLAQAGHRLRLDALGLRVTSAVEDGRALVVWPSPETSEVEVHGISQPESTIRLAFEGRTLPGALTGLYRSREANGHVLTTQCAPVGARQIFPCIDRPDRKATFSVSIQTDERLGVIFNMPAVAAESHDGKKRWRFGSTPPMAPYLFYLAIGSFERRDASAPGTPVALHTAPGETERGAYALSRAGPTLQACAEFYQIPYPLPKLDLVSVREFPYGAMENWGAISFRDQRLLVDDTTTESDRREVFETVAHEIAHQWFGNLVTMRWWTDIWLNESFATFLEQKLVDAVEPGFDALSDLLLIWTGPARFADSFDQTHPVVALVDRPEEISQVFDTISYGKGSSVLRMVEQYLGPEQFRAGVTQYLRAHQDGNAESADLWQAIESTSGHPAASTVKPWFTQAGIPVLIARPGAQGIELEQGRFRIDGKHDTNARWPIPLAARIDGLNQRLLLEGATGHLPAPQRSIQLNVDALGFYRVLYDPSYYNLLLSEFNSLSSPERWGLLEDLGTFRLSGDVPRELYEKFLRLLENAEDYAPVYEAVRELHAFWVWTGGHPLPAEIAKRFLRPQSDRLGLERRSDERPTDAVLRGRVALARARVDQGYAGTLAPRFMDWQTISPDVQAAVAISLAQTGGASGFEAIRKALQSARSEAETLRLEKALAWSGDATLVEQALAMIPAGGINRGHIPRVLAAAARNPMGREVTWRWMQRQLRTLERQFRGTGFLSSIVEWTMPYVGLSRPEEVREFYRQNRFPEATRGLAMGDELLSVCLRLVERLD